jgi:uncharacterized membrane protein YjjB (DUF3815 family)
MDIISILVLSVLAGAFALCYAVLFGIPRQALSICFAAALLGRLAREMLIVNGVGTPLATVVASAVITFVAVLALRSRGVVPMVIVSGALPLVDAVAVFQTITGLIHIPSAQPEQRTEVVITVVANAIKFFGSMLEVIVGMSAGIVFLRVFQFLNHAGQAARLKTPDTAR